MTTTFYFTNLAIWTADHVWGDFRPEVTVTDDVGQVRDSDIVHTTGNVTVTHGRPMTGRIDLVGPSTGGFGGGGGFSTGSVLGPHAGAALGPSGHVAGPIQGHTTSSTAGSTG